MARAKKQLIVEREMLMETSGSVDAVLAKIDLLKPKAVHYQNFFDGASVNHHEFNSAAKFHGAPSLARERDFTLGCTR